MELVNGKDHRALQATMQDLDNPSRTFESVLNPYFDRQNVLAWIATSILVHPADAVRHNLVLYYPTDSEKFFFVPCDYDEVMQTWVEPPGNIHSVRSSKAACDTECARACH